MTRRGYEHKKGGRGSLPFVQLHHYLLKSAAWADLKPLERALYLALKQRYNGRNNGSIGYGVREAAHDLGVSSNTANAAFWSLQAHGFVTVGKGSTFGQKRMAQEWTLTEDKNDATGEPSSKLFMRWRPESPFPVVKHRPPSHRSCTVIPLGKPNNAAA
jgi:DNA-binding transcriptional MocR family regulator